MQPLHMGTKILEDIYKSKQFDADTIKSNVSIDQISEREKFKAAKQILFGLAMLYVFTIAAYMIKPQDGAKLLDIITITFPPIATLILAAYFRDKK